ncbi:unnamed protein product, partial [Sphacelaria rigidula]
ATLLQVASAGRLRHTRSDRYFFLCKMQPPLKRRPRQRGGHGGQAVTATVEAPKHQREVVPYQPGGGDGACGLANSDGAAEKPVAVLSGKLSRCMPLFSPSSDMVFSACSSTVLALSVDTGEELFRLVGHRKDVTGMILLPKGT